MRVSSFHRLSRNPVNVLCLVRLPAIIDAVNSDRVGRIQIKKDAPFADSQSVQSRAVRQQLYVAFPGFTVTREGVQNPNGGFAVDPA
jgi:hypothetical protein